MADKWRADRLAFYLAAVSKKEWTGKRDYI